MNLWINLPVELQNHILQIRELLILQRNVRIKLVKMNLARVFACEIIKSVTHGDQIHYTPLPRYSTVFINTMDPQIAIKLEYCAIHSCIGYINLWLDLCYFINEGLFFDQYTGGPGAKYYNRCELAISKLSLKYML
jgi:hypothetical protein